jgi:hypothetical protein
MFLDLPRDVLVRRQEFTQPDEGPHYCDVHLRGTLTAKNARKHCNALLTERHRELAAPAAATVWYHNLWHQSLKLFDRQPKGKILWKTIHIPFDLLIEGGGGDLIEFS